MVKRIFFGSILVVFGLLKLGDMCDIIHWDWLWQQPWTDYVGPIATMCLGCTILFGGHKKWHGQWLQHSIPMNENGKRIVCEAKFGGDEYVYHGEKFQGAFLRTHCGAILLDLREAVVEQDEEIEISNFIGGVELYVPKTVNVMVSSRSFIGGVGNETGGRMNANAPCLHIVAKNFIGGVSIKN